MKTKHLWQVIAKREMVVKLTDRNFIISTIVTLLMIIGGFVLLQVTSSNEGPKVGITSAEAQTVVTLLNTSNEPPWQTVSFSDEESTKAAVKKKDVDLALVKGDDGWKLFVQDLNQTSASRASQIRTALSATTLAEGAKAAGLDVSELTKGSNLTLISTSDENANQEQQLAVFVTGLVFAIFFFTMSLVFGLQIASSVVKEKESRVVEILSAAVPASQLLLGKILGNVSLAIGQMMLYAGTALLGLSFTQYANLIPLLSNGIGWFIIFFVAGFFALSCLWAASGAMATQYEDIQQTTQPITYLLLIGYMAAFVAPTWIKAVLSYVPVLSGVLMPGRLLDGSATWWQALIALILNLLFMAFAISIGGKLYKRGILQTSGTLKWRKAFAKAQGVSKMERNDKSTVTTRSNQPGSA